MVPVFLDDVFLVLVTFLDNNPALFPSVLHLQADPRIATDPPLAIPLGPVPDLLDRPIRRVVGMADTRLARGHRFNGLPGKKFDHLFFLERPERQKRFSR